MTTYVVLLRGINLGSHNKVAMSDLRSFLTELGAEDVSTYVQSGNAVMRSARKAEPLGRAVERTLADRLGLDIVVVVRTAAQMTKVVGNNPFAGREKDPTKLHVAFLSKAPGAKRASALEVPGDGPEAFEVRGREVYLHYPNGYGRSKLTNAFVEKRLGVSATNRNWRTVTKLAELAGA
jgi:uncharacterized protein (DUF1697 family)